ncbi:hypothetical protein [Phytoactinopolyspora halotolerans]|uniref:Uncharacterized protein n=1 Tax=Phytoactinopolyspora halotolerans TaxID=1981512 RepID=A0A6L9SAH4_9ACTN|nr:hypothetical protein [Phytoactinopolyspora halotolerans]NEE01572.1 hypothetical protein [Phytoactinopolyspora halotolerans]
MVGMAGRRWAAVAGLTIAPLIAVSVAAPAQAGESWTYRASGANASTQWIEMGTLPGGVPGNAHVGYLEVYTSSYVDVYGDVADWTCPEGELPPDGGGPHAEDEEPETNCEFEGFRSISGGDVEFTMDRKLDTARLTGTLIVENHETGEGAAPPVDITWTGVGDTAKSTETSRYTEGGVRYQSRYTSMSRNAQVDGFIGAMGFTDDPDDQSTAYMSRYTVHDRSVSR